MVVGVIWLESLLHVHVTNNNPSTMFGGIPSTAEATIGHQ